MDLSFSGAGFMGCYYFGIIDCWSRYIPRERVNRVAGASAGSLIAAYYLLELPLGPCLSRIIELTEDIRRRPLGVFDRTNQIVDVLPRILDELFPDDAHKRVSGRLFVCMTRLKDMSKVIVNEFASKQELIDALNCSCFIPVWSGNHVSTYKGVKHIDGGFSDNLPVFDEHTIRICCFSGPSDISPYDRVKMESAPFKLLNTPLYLSFTNCRRFARALLPPPASFIVGLLERGFHDAKQFILSTDLIQCDTCYDSMRANNELPTARLVTPTISPGVSPAVSRRGSRERLARSPYRPLKSADGLLAAANSFATPTSQRFNSLLERKLEQQAQDINNNNNNNSDNNCDSDINCDNRAPTIIVVDEPRTQPDKSQQQAKAEAEAEPEAEVEPEAEAETGEIARKLLGGKRVKLDSTSDYQSQGSSSPLSGSGSASLSRGRRPTLPANVPSEKFLQRRGSVQPTSEPPLPVEDKFTLAPEPLPSCPPSPNLNRHCTECIRMRQEARVDQLEAKIKQEAQKFVEASAECGKRRAVGKRRTLSRTLATPIKWIRQIGTKTSYKFDSSAAGIAS